MGKLAENEQHRLRAGFRNNLAVTAAASGVLLPVFGIIAKYGEWARGKRVMNHTDLFNHLAEINWVIDVMPFLFIFGATAWAAYVTATLLRESADEEAAKIQD